MMKGLGVFPSYIKPTPAPRVPTVPLTMKAVLAELVADENTFIGLLNAIRMLAVSPASCKTRYGRAFVFEPVYVKSGFNPGAKVTALGRILFIAQNTGHKLLRLYPSSEMCLLIHWHTVDKDHFVPPFSATMWESADRFSRCEYGDGPPWAGLWSTR